MTPAVLARGLRFPEGPAFAPDGALWVSEVQGGALARIDRDGSITRIDVGGAPVGLAVDDDAGLWICDAERNQIRRRAADGDVAVMADAADGAPLDGPNDLAFAPDGALVFTCAGPSREAPTGYLCRLDEDGGCRRIAELLQLPNGIAFVDDGASLIVAETRRHRLWRGAWHAGSWRDPTPFALTDGPAGPGGPDGLAVDAGGRLLVAIHGSGTVEAFAATGERVASLRVAGMKPTSVALDPLGTWGLIVTEAEHGTVLAYDLGALS